MARPDKQKNPQVTAGVLSVLAVGAMTALLGWLAVQLTVRLVDTFEVVAVIVGWILLPLRL